MTTSKTTKKIIILSLAAITLLCLSSCYTPSPLYGTWADNTSSKITFMEDGTFSASITDTAGAVTLYDGTWSVIDNVLIFTKSSGSTVDTEWDIRGALLYLDWVDDYNETQSLTLYHTAK